MMPTKSLARTPTTLVTEHDDVSIEISGDDEPNDLAPQPHPASNL
jgi:hypothetical protein